MKIRTSTLAFSLFAAAAASMFLAPADASAQNQRKEKTFTETQNEAMKRTRQARQVSGTILNTKTVDVRGGKPNVIAMIKTTKGDRRVIVDLGPQAALSGLSLERGNRIAAEGIVVSMRDRQLLVADRVKAGDRTLTVDRSAQTRAREAARKSDGQKQQNQGSRRPKEGQSQ